MPGRAKGILFVSGIHLECTCFVKTMLCVCLACRGTFNIDADLHGDNGILPDSFLVLPGWAKAVLFVNSINLGWS